MEIKAIDVKKLREKTGAGMMDCKKALVKAEGDFKKAERLLKELGLAAARKRDGRATTEGQIFSHIDGNSGVLLELASETDFVAKNTEFIALGHKLADLIIKKRLDKKTEEIDALITKVIGRIKENLELKRFKLLTAGADEILVDYIHNVEGIGKIGVLLLIKTGDASLKENEKLKAAAFDIALHIAACAPMSLSAKDVDSQYLKEQEEIFLKQAQNLGKPEKVINGIVKGKLNKHLSEICLLDQTFVKDQKVTIAKYLDSLSKESGSVVTISDYLYYKLGE